TDLQMIAIAAEDAPLRKLLNAELEIAVDLHARQRRRDDLARDDLDQPAQGGRVLGCQRQAIRLWDLTSQRAYRGNQRGAARENAERGEERRPAAGHECVQDREAAGEDRERDPPRDEIAERSSHRDLAPMEPRMLIRLALELANQRREIAAVHDCGS